VKPKQRPPSTDAMGAPAKTYPGELPPAQPLTGFADPFGSRPVTDLVVFGATGDLMKRLLMPSLLGLTKDQGLPSGSKVLGVGRADGLTDEAFREQMREAAQKFAKVGVESPDLSRLTETMGFQQAKFTAEDLAVLEARLKAQDAGRKAPAQRLLYLALPPQVLPTAIEALKAAGLLDVVPGQPPPRLVLEKPFGHDLESARALRDLLEESLADPKGQVRWQDRVLLIDHYMGKAAVAELRDLRFGKPSPDEPWNGAFESMLNGKFVERIEIQAEENVDIGSAKRGAFMEAVGAFRDMFQSHLQQVASLLVMEGPTAEPGSFDRAQADALLHFHTLSPDEVKTHTVRSQYTEGHVGDHDVQAYREVDGVAKDSKVETFFAVRTRVEDPKWNGVPFFIWSGKALEEKETSVRIDFKAVSPELQSLLEREAPTLAAKVGPGTAVALTIGIDPAPHFTLEVAGEKLLLKAPESFDQRLPHQRLLEEALEGKTDLFVSPEEALAQWEHADAVLKAWASQPGGPLLYTAGTLPEAAAEYMDDDDRKRGGKK
jgi:glucose-6-phosphate 1-dehydrogenase